MRHSRKYILASATFILGLTMPVTASAACKLSIRSTGQTQIKHYQALSRTHFIESIRLKLENEGSSDCVGKITFEGVDGIGRLVGPQNTSLKYLVVDEHNINRVLFDPNTFRQTGIPIRIAAYSRKEIRPKFFLPRRQEGISGEYLANIRAIFQSKLGDRHTESTKFQLGVVVLPSVQANFVGVSRASRGSTISTLNLGEITPGKRQTMGLQIRANTDVDIELSSRNNGRLVNEDRENASIGYELIISGSTQSLSTSTALNLPASVSHGGKTSRIVVQIENYNNAPAGQYSDTILFRITAR